MRITQVICDGCGNEIKKIESSTYGSPKGRFRVSVSFSEGSALADMCIPCLWRLVKEVFEHQHRGVITS